ncbi:MAG: 6,7-dimethyl-8-ribityllumazine synthase [Bacteroidota bacterium]|nr:6,7-dimethyl-8-ribityllumazine synthase [Bacteroidota bacterium]
MASSLKNLSDYDINAVPSAKGLQFGLVVAEWNNEITEALANGAIDTLLEHEVSKEDIFIKRVPGAFELSLGAQFFAEYTTVDAIICIGCVIEGGTPHFEYICQGVTQGITKVGLDYNIPVIFGVLTTNNLEQAQERAGGIHGNKGVEAAVTAIKMADLQEEMMDASEDE